MGSVTEIYNYYKKHGYNTIVMGASFRNVDEILELTGCDRLTISPGLIAELQASSEPITKKLCATAAVDMDIPKIEVDMKTFRWMDDADDDDIESDGTKQRERRIVVILYGPIYYSSYSLLSIIYCTNFPQSIVFVSHSMHHHGYKPKKEIEK